MEALALLGYGALGAIFGLGISGQLEAEPWTWGLRLHPVEGAAPTLYLLVAITALALWGRWLLLHRRRP